MSVAQFYATISAVMFGNFLTIAGLYAVWRATRIERDGGDASQLPWFVLIFGGIAPPAIALAALHFTVVAS